MDDSFGNSLLSGGSPSNHSLDISTSGDLFRPNSNFLNMQYDHGTAKLLELQRELAQERMLRKEAQRELDELKKYMFTDMSAILTGGLMPTVLETEETPSSTLSADVPSYTPIRASSTLKSSPFLSSSNFYPSSQVRNNVIRESLDILGNKDLLLCDDDIMTDIDVLAAKKNITSPDKNSGKRDTSRHYFGAESTPLSPRTHSGDRTNTESPAGSTESVSPKAIVDSAKKRADVAPLDIDELELWLKCKSDFTSKWMQQKTEFLEKWNFCQEQFMSRWMKEVTARFNTEDMYEYPIKCFIYYILSNRGPQPCGEIGKILKEITQNNEIHLMQMIKVNYKGLKKFIELFSDIFHIGTEHPFNPTVYLKNRYAQTSPFPAHIVGNLDYANEILELGLKVNNIENEHSDRTVSDDVGALPLYSSSPSLFFENNSVGGGFYHRNQSISTDSAVSSRSNSAASHRDSSADRKLAHTDQLFYDPATDTWSGIGQGTRYSSGPGYDKSASHGIKPYHSKNVKRPSHSNIFSVAIDPPLPPPVKGSYRKK